MVPGHSAESEILTNVSKPTNISDFYSHWNCLVSFQHAGTISYPAIQRHPAFC